MVHRAERLSELVEMIPRLSERAETDIIVYKHFGGHAFETARRLSRLLGLSLPNEPERRTSTLFD